MRKAMIYKQVHSNDHGSHTHLQVIISHEGGIPVFHHYGKKVADRIHIKNGSVFSCFSIYFDPTTSIICPSDQVAPRLFVGSHFGPIKP